MKPIARTLSSAALLALVLVPATSQAFTRTGSTWNPNALPVSYRTNTASAPTSLGGATAVRTVVQSGFDAWAAPVCTTFRAANVGETTVTRASSNDRVNTVLWISSNWPAELGDVNSTIGVTTPVWTSGSYTIDADIQFNSVGFSWNMTGTNGGVDTLSIATHEEGHFLGLGHTPTLQAIMYASYSGGAKRTLHTDDITGVCTLYPSGTALPDAGTMTGTDPVGAPCGSTPCVSGYQCVQATGVDPFCTRDCSTRACPTDFMCTMTNIGQLCVPSSGSMSMGTGRTGDTCTSGAQCASGICVGVSASRAICTQACQDDCSCPANYECLPTTQNVNVCGPGTNTCTTSVDAGARDSGGSTTDVPTVNPEDAEMDAGAPDGGTGMTNSGCGCRIPARSTGPSTPWAAWFTAIALTGVLARRRRP